VYEEVGLSAGPASPIVRRRRFASELKRLRTASGKTLDDVAAYLECSPAKISRIETAQVGVSVPDARELLEFYGVKDPQREELLGLVRQARGRSWWNAYSDLATEDRALLDLVGYEHEASLIWTYETRFVPALLQTESYAHAVISARRDEPLGKVQRGLEFRRMRQEILIRENAPRLHAIIDESVLEWLAGSGPALLGEQCTHLIAMAAKPTLTLQVLPFSKGVQASGGIPFVILEFADPADPRVVYADLLSSNQTFDRAEDVGVYHSEFQRLRSGALSPADSIDLIASIANRVDG